MKQTHISRAGRKAQIIMNIYERTAGDTIPICTTYSIAKGIGMSPSTHVKKIIDELANEGWINQKRITDLFGRTSVLHWLTNDAYDLMRNTYLERGADLKFVKAWFEQ